MTEQSKADSIVDALNKLADTAYVLIAESVQKEDADYTKDYMDKLYSKNLRADQIEAVKEVLFELAIGNSDMDACTYILEHQDWFLEDLTQLPKKN